MKFNQLYKSLFEDLDNNAFADEGYGDIEALDDGSQRSSNVIKVLENIFKAMAGSQSKKHGGEFKEGAQQALDALREYTNSHDWEALMQAEKDILGQHGEFSEITGSFLPSNNPNMDSEGPFPLKAIFTAIKYSRRKGLDEVTPEDLPETIEQVVEQWKAEHPPLSDKEKHEYFTRALKYDRKGPDPRNTIGPNKGWRIPK